MNIARFPLFLIGFALMLGLFLAQRFYTYSHSEFTHGVLFSDQPFTTHYYEEELILYYYVGCKEYAVPVMADGRQVNKRVRVRYPEGKPEQGDVYQPWRFWGVSALWLLFPLMLWGAFVFTLLDEDGRLSVTWVRRHEQGRDTEKQKQIESKDL